MLAWVIGAALGLTAPATLLAQAAPPPARRAAPAATPAPAPAAAPAPAPAAPPGPQPAPIATPGPDGSPPVFPRRKPGLWEVRSAGSQAAGLPAMRYCVGEQTDTPAAHLDRAPGARGACTMGAFQRAGDAWHAISVCKESRVTVTSHAVASGNFETDYRIDTVVTYDPPLAGTRREDKDAVVAKMIGPCPTTHRPGDMIVPGMGILNMNDGSLRPEPEPKAPKRRGPPPRKAPATTA